MGAYGGFRPGFDAPPRIQKVHTFISESALKSEHGVNKHPGSPLGDVQVCIQAFFVFREAVSEEKGCA